MDEYNTKKTIAALILAAGRSSRMQHGQESYHKLLLPLGQGTVLSQVIATALTSQAHPIILILGFQSAQIRASLTDGGKPSPYVDTNNCNVVIDENTDYGQGMSTSLHKGIRILMNQDNSLRKKTNERADPNTMNLGMTPDMEYPFQCVDEGLAPSRPLRPPSLPQLLPSPSSSQPLTPSPSPTAQCAGALILLGDQPLITPALLNQLIELKYTTGKRIIAPFYNGKRGNPVLFAADLFPELLTLTGDEGGRSVIEKHRAEVGRLDIDASQAWYDMDTWDAYQQVLRTWQEQEK